MESRSNDGFANNNNVFADASQQYNQFDNLNLFQSAGPDSSSAFNDASWGVNTNDVPNPNPNQSRASQSALPSWQQNANHLSARTQGGYPGQASPYARTLNQSPASFNHHNFNNFAAQQQAYPYRQAQYDHSLLSQAGPGQSYNHVGIRGFNPPVPNGGTITPQALDGQAKFSNNPYASNAYSTNLGQVPATRQVYPANQTRPIDQRALAASVPRSADHGMFSIVNFENLARATNSERLGSYINVGKEAVEWDCTRSAVPYYVPRKSRNELRAAAGNNAGLLAKIGKKKKKTLPASLGGVKSVSSPDRIKYEQDTSSSEESSDDDSDSEYSDESDSDSPLPSKRPTDPKSAIEYDTIKALWRSKRRSLDGQIIRTSLVEFWELIKTIRDRWKIDAAAFTEAEQKKRTAELPLLQSRVKDQRDMIEAAFRASLKHGHRDIVEWFSENVSLLFVCYQFLLDRLKADDVNGGLARAILETLSLSSTLSTEKIEKVHLDKVLPRMQKKGDAKTQHWIRKINANSESADKQQKSDNKSHSIREDNKGGSPAKKPGQETVAGVKRAATSTAGEGTASKKLATSLAKPNGAGVSSSKVNGLVKKATGEAGKAASAINGTVTKKPVAAKPSGFLSSLQSASKKPGTSIADKPSSTAAKPMVNRASAAPKPAFSFAETMASLSKPKEEKPVPKPEKAAPPETAEERAKRLRKEERRKLHVHFKTEDLVQIQYFTHDPEEEIDHDSSQMRDVSDVGGEGRMFKQQSHMMDLDDEDDAVEETENLRDFKSPSFVDFSVVDPEERKRNYAPYGGGEIEIESKERAARDLYESNNLIVFYTDASQIPPNPKEPADPYNGESGEAIKYFGAPDENLAIRARAKGQQRIPQFMYGQAQTQQHAPYQHGFLGQAPPPTAPVPDIQKVDISEILAAIQAQAQPSVQTPPPIQPPPPMQPPAPTLEALLAQLNPQAATGGMAPNMSGPTQPGQMFAGVANGGKAEGGMSGARHPNYKTRPCRFWKEGRCQKGDACSYLHE